MSQKFRFTCGLMSIVLLAAVVSCRGPEPLNMVLDNPRAYDGREIVAEQVTIDVPPEFEGLASSARFLGRNNPISAFTNINAKTETGRIFILAVPMNNWELMDDLKKLAGTSATGRLVCKTVSSEVGGDLVMIGFRAKRR